MVRLTSFRKGGEMRSGVYWRRRSLVTLGEAIFKSRKICKECGEKILQKKSAEAFPTVLKDKGVKKAYEGKEEF